MSTYPKKQKAIDLAMYRNNNGTDSRKHIVTLTENKQYQVLRWNNPDYKKEKAILLPEDYSQMDYNGIQEIREDHDPHKHLEEIFGMLAVLDGKILRFLLNTKFPFEKAIRYELAIRGYDEYFNWVGFEQSEKIWLK